MRKRSRVATEQTRRLSKREQTSIASDEPSPPPVISHCSTKIRVLRPPILAQVTSRGITRCQTQQRAASAAKERAALR